MGLYAFGHEYIVEHTVVIQLVATLRCFGGIETSAEIVRLHHLAERLAYLIRRGYVATQKPVYAAYAKTPFLGMDVVVIVGCVQKEIAVVEYSDLGRSFR